MKKKGRAGVPKRGSARKTKAPASRAVKAPGHQERPKPSEGGRPSRSPFHTEWQYLDLGERTTPKAAATDRGGAGKVEKGRRSQRSAPNAVVDRAGRDGATPPRTLTYFEPTKPWQEKTDKEVLKWLREQDEAYQAHVDESAAAWLSKGRAIAAGRSLTDWLARWLAAPDVRMPTDEELVAYVRRLSAPACPCGFDGSPRSFHTWDLRRCMRRPRVPLIKEEADDEDDDDLPF